MDESGHRSAVEDCSAPDHPIGVSRASVPADDSAHYRVHDYCSERIGAEEPVLHPMRPGCSDILILAKGARVRVRPEFGAIWIPVGSGLQCTSAAYRSWSARGEACVTEARQEVEISAPERHDSVVIGILPQGHRLERASCRVSGSNAPMSVLFPEVAWRTGMHLGLPCHAVLQWRGLSRSDEMLTAWADRMLSACLDHQSTYRALVSRCSGRSLQQKQVMLCRLLRGRIAMQCREDPTVADGAKAALLSAWRFIALHREVFGDTPARSACQHRLDQALHQLRSGELAVMDVAEIVGYRNRSSFSRAFKSRFGISPAEASLKLRRS